MHPRKAMTAGAAALAIGAAFAQPVSMHADRSAPERLESMHWAPGTNGVMAVYEMSATPVAPPQ